MLAGGWLPGAVLAPVLTENPFHVDLQCWRGEGGRGASRVILAQRGKMGTMREMGKNTEAEPCSGR